MPLVAFASVDTPDDALDMTASRVEEITLGIVCARIVGTLLLPVRLNSSIVDRPTVCPRGGAVFDPIAPRHSP